MKITDNRKVPFENITVGDIFEVNGVLYLKTNEVKCDITIYNAIMLRDYTIVAFSPVVLCKPVNAELVIQ